MVILTVFSERRLSEGRRVKLSQKKAQFRTLLWIVLLIKVDFRWHCHIASLFAIAAPAKI